MYTTPYREWFSRRLDIANDIFNRHKYTGEPDAQIILCCAVGTLAAMRWPKSEDNRRFIQFLVKFAPETRRISIPILIEKFYKEGDNDSAKKLICKFLQHQHQYDGKLYLDNRSLPEPLLPRLLDSDQIDQLESEIIKELSKELQPDGSRKKPKWRKKLPNGRDKRRIIRESSYAALMYTDFRCGLVHGYRAKGAATSTPSSSRRDVPSYTNLQFLPDEETVKKAASKHSVSLEKARAAFTDMKRRLYFPYEYIRDTMIHAADSAFTNWDTWPDPDSYKTLDVWAENAPEPWWITKYGK